MSACAACGDPVEGQGWLCPPCTERHWEGPMAHQEGRLPTQVQVDRAENDVLRRLRERRHTAW